MPLSAAMLAGFAWMIEHGWLIEFIVASISLGGLVALIRLTRLWMRGREAGRAPRPDQLHARVDPSWNAPEVAAFEAAHEAEFGFTDPEAELIVEAVEVEGEAPDATTPDAPHAPDAPREPATPEDPDGEGDR